VLFGPFNTDLLIYYSCCVMEISELLIIHVIVIVKIVQL
jgi:hypothetical protein